MNQPTKIELKRSHPAFFLAACQIQHNKTGSFINMKSMSAKRRLENANRQLTQRDAEAMLKAEEKRLRKTLKKLPPRQQQ